MFSKMFEPMMMVVVSWPMAQSIGDSFGMKAYSDGLCKKAAANDGNGLSDYMMAQLGDDKHCYSHNGYSIKLTCGSDDTMNVDHWLDVTGNQAPCTGAKIAGEPLLQSVPWEIALDLFNGECVWSAEHDKYAKLTAPLPSNGFPKCDFTGASIRRLSSPRRLNGTNQSTLAPTAAPTVAPTPAPTAAATNATVNTTAPTPAPAAAPVGTASGAPVVGRAIGVFAVTVLAM